MERGREGGDLGETCRDWDRADDMQNPHAESYVA
jgi:hypothetical protein